MSDKDKDKEEDERDVGECEHQDPPEQPGAGLAAVQAFRISKWKYALVLALSQ